MSTLCASGCVKLIESCNCYMSNAASEAVSEGKTSMIDTFKGQ